MQLIEIKGKQYSCLDLEASQNIVYQLQTNELNQEVIDAVMLENESLLELTKTCKDVTTTQKSKISLLQNQIDELRVSNKAMQLLVVNTKEESEKVSGTALDFKIQLDESKKQAKKYKKKKFWSNVLNVGLAVGMGYFIIK